MGKAETYWPANSLAKAKRIDENEMVTYSFEVEYCIKRLLLEYHSGENLLTEFYLENWLINCLFLQSCLNVRICQFIRRPSTEFDIIGQPMARLVFTPTNNTFYLLKIINLSFVVLI